MTHFPAQDFHVSEQGLELIRRFEGCRPTPYLDLAGVWTIGFGHTGVAAQQGAAITEQEADTLLGADVAMALAALQHGTDVPLSQPQIDAAASFIFNIGSDAFLRSTARRRLHLRDWAGTAAAMQWWNKATVNGKKVVVAGLVRRRAAEAELFLTGIPEQWPDQPVVATQVGSS